MRWKWKPPSRRTRLRGSIPTAHGFAWHTQVFGMETHAKYGPGGGEWEYTGPLWKSKVETLAL